MMKREFAITGMSCASCQHHVQKAVKKLRGVHNVNVNLVSATMTLECDAQITAQTIIDQVKKAGYGAREITNTDINVTTDQSGLKKN